MPDDEEENTEDYGRLLSEYKAARRCSAWLKNAGAVLDLGERCS
jgi:hypothetical protein